VSDLEIDMLVLGAIEAVPLVAISKSKRNAIMHEAFIEMLRTSLE
jgi:hypothetical protein